MPRRVCREDGRADGAERRSIREKVASEIKEVKSKHPRFRPSLAIIQQGERPDSTVYVRMKQQAAEAAGIEFQHLKLPDAWDEAQVTREVQRLNDDPSVHGLLVQLPLSKAIGSAGERRITESVSPQKDVDGFHAYNIGLLSSRASEPLFAPCTPAGAMKLIEMSGISISGKHAVVLGRSDIVGSPVCSMLRRKDATVTQCHSRTQNLPGIVRPSSLLGLYNVLTGWAAQNGGYRRRCHWLGVLCQGRMAQTRLRRHRRRYQLHSGLFEKVGAASRRRCRILHRRTSRWSHHPGAWRSRSDDGRYADGQYASSG